MNTRRYPRTMNEAFHNTVEYGSAIERPRRGSHTAANLAVICGAIYLIVLFLWERLT